MQFDIDLIQSGRDERRGSTALVAGLACFGLGLAMVSVMNANQLAAAQARTQAQSTLDELQQSRQTANASTADSELTTRLREYQYVQTFPWTDVLAALESVGGAQLVSITSATEQGVVRAEFTARNVDAASAVAAQLAAALPTWKITITRQSQQAGRIALTLDLIDRARIR